MVSLTENNALKGDRGKGLRKKFHVSLPNGTTRGEESRIFFTLNNFWLIGAK